MTETAMFSLLRCDACGAREAGPFRLCPHCGVDALCEVVPDVAERGVLVTWTVVRRPPPRFADAPGYVVGVVDLERGGRLVGRVQADAAALHAGQPVLLLSIHDEMPRFVPACG